MRTFSLIIVLFFVTSCYGINKDVGYSVFINIEQDAMPKAEDIKLITEYLCEVGFEVVEINEKEMGKYELYKKNLKTKEFDKLKYNYIRVAVEYSSNQSSNESGALSNIEIRIGNSREGSTPVLQNEIDLVADRIEEKLSNRFGIKNFSIKRKIVSPM